MELNRLMHAIAWAMGIMVAIGVLAVLLALFRQDDLATTWHGGWLFLMTKVVYVLTLCAVMVYMLGYRNRLPEYLPIPVLPFAFFVSDTGKTMPAELILVMMYCYLVAVLYWTIREREASTPELA